LTGAPALTRPVTVLAEERHVSRRRQDRAPPLDRRKKKEGAERPPPGVTVVRRVRYGAMTVVPSPVALTVNEPAVVEV
jgi:hypothetical protein